MDTKLNAARPFMPPPLPECFVERPDELNALVAKLLDKFRQNSVVIKGAGGFGKTTLAAALCHNNDVQTAFNDGILWVTLGEHPNILGELTKLYAALTGEHIVFVNVDEGSHQVAKKLANHDCLMVIDDVCKPAHLRPFLHGGERCTRLITTRNRDFVVEFDAESIVIDEMKNAEAVQMLLAGINPVPADSAVFCDLVIRLGHWPLILKLANAALRKRIARRMSPEKAVAWLEAAFEREGVQVVQPSTTEARSRFAGSALEIIFVALEENDRLILLQYFFQLGVFAEGVDISLSALAALWHCSLTEAEHIAGRLADISLLSFDPENETIRLHDFIRQYARSQIVNLPIIHARLLDGWGDPYNLPDGFAWTYFIDHTLQAGRNPTPYLLDYHWLRAKLFAPSPPTAILIDFDLVFNKGTRFLASGDLSRIQYDASAALQSGEDERATKRAALRLLHTTLQLCLPIICDAPDQFATQLAGRLYPYRDQPALAAFYAAITPEPNIFFPISPAPTHTPPGGTLLRTLAGHTAAVNGALMFDERILSWSGDGTLRLWAANGEPLTELVGHTSSVSGAIALSDECILSWSGDETLRLWDTNRESLAVCIGHNGRIYGAIPLSDKRFLSWAEDKTLRLWSANGKSLAACVGHKGRVYGAIVLSDDRILSWSGDGTLRLWSSGGEALASLTGHSSRVYGTTELSNGHILSWSEDKTLRIWSNSGEPLTKLVGHKGRVYGATELSDERILSWSEDKTLRLWSSTGDSLAELIGHRGSVFGAIALLDGRILSWSADDTLRLWSPNGAELTTLSVHRGSIFGANVLLDGRILSWSEDSTIRLWSSSGQPLTAFYGDAPITCCLVTPSGTVVAGDAQGRVLFLRLP